MNTLVLYACGVINALFALFHLGLARSIQHLTLLSPGHRALLHALNFGGFLFLIFLAVAFLACQPDLRTRLGRATILLGAAIYLTRAFEEFVLFPRIGWVVVVLCTIAGLLHLAALRAAPARA